MFVFIVCRQWEYVLISRVVSLLGLGTTNQSYILQNFVISVAQIRGSGFDIGPNLLENLGRKNRRLNVSLWLLHGKIGARNARIAQLVEVWASSARKRRTAGGSPNPPLRCFSAQQVAISHTGSHWFFSALQIVLSRSIRPQLSWVMGRLMTFFAVSPPNRQQFPSALRAAAWLFPPFRFR